MRALFRTGVILSILLLALCLATNLEAGRRVPGEVWLMYAQPEEAGFSSEKLAEAREYYETTGSAGVFVVYRGAVLVNWGETSRRLRCHSVRKSFMSGLYGIHIDRGGIDKNKSLAELGIDDAPYPLTEQEKTARIVDLLAARSGVYLPAAYEPPNPKPERGSHAPGTNWCYNNWDFNTLVTILEQETPVKVFEEFDRRFAKPLGMQDYQPAHGYYHYERDKSMHPAYPFRMSARDMARFGLLYLYGGQWDTERILSEQYVKESTSRMSDSAWDVGGYGYMWWLPDVEPLCSLGTFSALGVGGQSIDVIPGADMVFINRTDTYGQDTDYVDSDERYQMIRMILEAKIGEPKEDPELVSLPEPEPSYTPQPMTTKQMALYAGEYPIADTGEKVRVFTDEGQLMTEFGEGPFPVHNLGSDHLIVEDLNEHMYFEEDENGSKHLIALPILLAEARSHLGAGRVEQAKSALAKAQAYYSDEPSVFRSLADVHLRTAGEALGMAIENYRRVNEMRPRETIDRSPLAWELVSLCGQIIPPKRPPSHLARFAGRYGPRLVELEEGCLYYSREGGPRAELISLTENVFAVEGIDYFRVRFDTDENGNIFRLTGLYQDGRRDESLRDAEP